MKLIIIYWIMEIIWKIKKKYKPNFHTNEGKENQKNKFHNFPKLDISNENYINSINFLNENFWSFENNINPMINNGHRKKMIQIKKIHKDKTNVFDFGDSNLNNINKNNETNILNE